jgi:hypothetical protein
MTTILAVDQVGAHFDYGPPDRTRLILTLLGEDGKEHPLVFEARALRQLAQLLSDIQARFPGALGGH